MASNDRYVYGNTFGYVWDVNTLTWIKGKQALLSTDTLEVSLAGVATAANQSTQTTHLSNIAAKDFATQATLANLLTELQAKADLVDTQPISVEAPAFASRSDTFTTTGNGAVINGSPLQWFAVQVKGTGAAATSWSVFLEGSLDGTNFSPILNHVTATTDGSVLWLGGASSPALYIRSRCADLTLGSATNIVVTIIGTA